MNIEISSVSRKEQKLSETAAAAYVVTGEDIRRSGVTSIPEALRMVPGLQVARVDANKWAISSRGFNGRFSNKMLVMIDGRSIYNNVYTGVFWEQYDLLLEDIERIEVVRGPGGTMWGANAVNGVINIITKSTQDTHGLMLATGTGNVENASAGVRYGGGHGERLNYRVWGKYFNRGPMVDGQGDRGNDRWRSTRGGGRIDWQLSDRDLMIVQGDGYSGSAGQMVYPGYPVTQLMPAVEDEVMHSGAYALARWEHQFSERSETVLQFYYDALNREEMYGDGGLRAADLDFQHRYSASDRHDLVWGLGYRRLSDNIEPRIAQFIPQGRKDNLYSTFLQDDISLVPDKLVLTAGSKFQHNDYSGWEIQPSVRLLWALGERRSVWTAVSRAVRTPGRYDHDLQIDFDLPPINGMRTRGRLNGDRSFSPESVLAYEAGYRQQVGRRFNFDLAAFYNRYDQLQDLRRGEPQFVPAPEPSLLVPVLFWNGGEGDAYGVEVATTTNLTSRWQLHANYTWLRANLRYEGNFYPSRQSRDPSHQAQFRSNVDITERVEFDTTAYHVSSLTTGVPSYTRLDARLGWRVNGHFDLSFVAQNLLDDRHLEFIPEDYARHFEVRRAVFVKLTTTF